MYLWAITKADPDSLAMVGVSGPRGADPTKFVGDGQEFIMLDGMGTYLRGRLWGNFGGFEPLDDYGEPMLGLNAIYLRDSNTGKFVEC